MSNDTQPEIRFPGFTEDWEERKLSEVANHRGGTAIEKYFKEDGKYKVISIGSYGLDSKYVDQNIRAVSNEVTDSRVVRNGELTMVLNDKTANGTIIGRSLLIEEDNKYVINQRTEIISPKENFDSNFAYTILNGPFRESVKRIVQGGTQIYVNYPAVSNLVLKLPDVEEQKKIGLFFKQLDDTITLQQRKLDLLKETKKGFLQKMFPKNGAKVPEIRFPGFTEDWEERKFSDFTKLSQGLQIAISDRFTEAGPNKEFYITNEFLNPNNTKKYYIENPSKNVIANKNDILMTRTGNTGKVVTNTKGAFHNNFFKIDYDPQKISKLFLYFLLTSIPIQKEILIRAGTSTIPDLNHKDFYNIKVYLPIFEEQKKIGSFFKQLDDTIALHQRKLDLLKETKKGFLQKMFV
ncbi:restriction endonuclease subunit S [Enterococcus faecium]|nr:restriction endonuclease subunit S [Enterococcus faecium]